MHLDSYEASEKHAPNQPFTRVGPEEVITSDPVFVRHMLNFRSMYQKSD